MESILPNLLRRSADNCFRPQPGHIHKKTLPTIFFTLVILLSSLFSPLTSFSKAATLNVTLVNGLSGEILSGIKITASERLETGKLKWVANHETDSQGLAVFDLDGLGSGKTYVLYTKVYNNITAYSDDLNNPGNYLFKIGKLQVKVVSGIDGSLLPEIKVTAKERLADGKLKWLTSGKTDEQGIIRLDLRQLGEGKICVLCAQSPTDGSNKYSNDLTTNGYFDFIVGNHPLNVTLVNGLSGEILSGIKITASERLETGKLKWVASRETDDQGRAVFDLEDLGNGRIYTLSCNPYNGGTVYSPDLNQPQNYTFRVGTLPVKLVDGDLGLALVGKKIVTYEKSPEGKLHWRKSGTTDENGLIIFDLPDLNEGRVYVAKVYDPFGNDKKYYSPWITSEGELLFTVNREGEYSPDLTPPWINIDSPKSETLVSDIGFTLNGRATDNQEIARIEIMVSDPITGQHLSQTVFNPDNGHWQMSVPKTMLTAGQTVSITAKAIDTAHNFATTSINLVVTLDDEAPKLAITSHSNNDSVSSSGFLISGYATDNTGITGLRASLTGPQTASTIISENLPVSASSGNWTLAVDKNLLTTGTTIKLSFTATDGPGNETSADISLLITESLLNAGQLLNRITFGATPTLLKEINRTGAENFLAKQLQPQTIDNLDFDNLIGTWMPEYRDDLTWRQLMYAAYSHRQLQEMMTWFWENHFNTDISTHGQIIYEVNENQLFREHALGKFKDLLTISATSPAMLYYLDNVSNRRQAPNENYAREIMELHTLGVDGGYTQADIVETARAFTGWRVHEGEFYFDNHRHDYDEKTVLGELLPAGQGIEDGHQVIDILARHPATARYISKKLLQFFISDEPTTELIEYVSQAFMGSDGDIAIVISLILHLPEFSDASNFHNKVKTPLEFTACLLRNLPVIKVERHLRSAMDSMGMRPYHYPLPTGWPETGDKWVNSNQLLQRLLLANGVAFNEKLSTSVCFVDLKKFFQSNGFETAPGIVGFLFNLALGNDYSQLEWDLAINILNGNQTSEFDINREDAELRLREMTGTVLSYPAYQLQ